MNILSVMPYGFGGACAARAVAHRVRAPRGGHAPERP